MADDEVTLPVRQGITLKATFAYKQPDLTYVNWNDWNVYSQIRSSQKTDGDLKLDLAPYLTIVDGPTPGDGKFLQLRVPGAATASLDPSGWNNARWNIIAVNKADHTLDLGVIDGPVTFDPSPTDVAAGEA